MSMSLVFGAEIYFFLFAFILVWADYSRFRIFGLRSTRIGISLLYFLPYFVRKINVLK